MFYPTINPSENGFLKRDEHEIYYEISGNMQGVPIVFLHGGPGSATNAWQRQFFNPEKFKIILLDQRGCGKSKPHGCLEKNTTSYLVDDLHALKEHVNIEKWHVFGGSWGSTLALAYADVYAEDFLSMTVYGVFLARQNELYNLYFEGGVTSYVFADKFNDFINLLGEKAQANPIQGYFDIFNGEDEELKIKALTEWTKWELQVSRLEVNADALNVQLDNMAYVLSHSLIENHYFMNHAFIEGDALLLRIGKKTKNFPVHIVQGRYDMVCPFKTAYELHRAIPHSTLDVIGNAGHTAKEPKTLEKIIKILNSL